MLDLPLSDPVLGGPELDKNLVWCGHVATYLGNCITSLCIDHCMHKDFIGGRCAWFIFCPCFWIRNSCSWNTKQILNLKNIDSLTKVPQTTCIIRTFQKDILKKVQTNITQSIKSHKPRHLSDVSGARTPMTTPQGSPLTMPLPKPIVPSWKHRRRNWLSLQVRSCNKESNLQTKIGEQKLSQ